jgi:hypothetical protein
LTALFRPVEVFCQMTRDLPVSLALSRRLGIFGSMSHVFQIYGDPPVRKLLSSLLVVCAVVITSGCFDRGGGQPIQPPATPPATTKNADPSRDAFVPTADPYNETATKVEYLPQNWTATESLSFYFTPQGSQVIPYDWFLALEQPGASATLFRDNQNILKYRYLPQNPDAWNPDGLPVGFTGETADNVNWLGMSCAACHTAELHVNNVAYRVDGAPTQANVQALLSDMIVAVTNTVEDPAKFDRFATKVLAGQNGPSGQSDLKAKIAKWLAIRSGYNRRNFPGYDPNATSPQGPLGVGRFGQLDAVGAIVNEVYWNAAKPQDLNNPTSVSKPADAPASYPFIWNAHQQDRVQWLGIAQSGGPGNILSLVRNVGEVIGVFGHVEIPDPIPLLNKGYRSTLDRPSLEKLEGLITTLWSPLWPDAFGKIDRDAATKGAEVFNRKLEQGLSCWDCHKGIKREDPNRSFSMTLFATGTDGKAFFNFTGRNGPSGKLDGIPANFIPLTAKIPANASATQMITNEVIGTILGTYTLNPPVDQLKNAQFGRRGLELLARAVVEPEYEARPLNGIWATAPYLHNGSVPTLDALFRKAADRPKNFTVGTRAFDTKKVGLAEPTAPSALPKLDTTLPGNTNTGHEFGASLSDDERAWLIEYLKTL